MAASRLTLFTTRTIFFASISSMRCLSAAYTSQKYTYSNYNYLFNSCSPYNYNPSYKRYYSTTDDGRDLKWSDVGSTELDSMINANNIQLIDVREPYELIENGQIKNSINVPLGEVEEALKLSEEDFYEKYSARKPSKSDDNIIFHCRAGIRSQTALSIAHQLGYSKARHYYPGYLGWVEYHNKY